jgi:hypothetical protein
MIGWPEDHPARFVWELVDEMLDLTPPPYHL